MRPDIPDWLPKHYPGYQDAVRELALSDEDLGDVRHQWGDPCTSCDAIRLREAWGEDAP